MHLREAATVVLVRDGGQGPEVCLLQRNPEAVFAGGAHVFPGGAVDAADHALVGHPPCATRDDAVASRALGIERGGLAYWVAAVRECFEEAGVLLARHLDGRPIDLTDSTTAERFVDHRRDLLAGRVTLADICGTESITLALDTIYYLSHWITPLGAPRRYDTRFFVAPAPAGQLVAPDDREVVADLWSTPAAALDLYATGEVDLILPTARSLEVLARFPHRRAVLDALVAAEATDVDQGPALVDDAGGRRRWLPGDPEIARALDDSALDDAALDGTDPGGLRSSPRPAVRSPRAGVRV